MYKKITIIISCILLVSVCSNIYFINKMNEKEKINALIVEKTLSDIQSKVTDLEDEIIYDNLSEGFEEYYSYRQLIVLNEIKQNCSSLAYFMSMNHGVNTTDEEIYINNYFGAIAGYISEIEADEINRTTILPLFVQIEKVCNTLIELEENYKNTDEIYKQLVLNIKNVEDIQNNEILQRHEKMMEIVKGIDKQ